MARNPVQFQKGISFNEFLSLYGTEDQCFDGKRSVGPWSQTVERVIHIEWRLLIEGW